jgi:hypothetical protein
MRSVMRQASHSRKGRSVTIDISVVDYADQQQKLLQPSFISMGHIDAYVIQLCRYVYTGVGSFTKHTNTDTEPADIEPAGMKPHSPCHICLIRNLMSFLMRLLSSNCSAWFGGFVLRDDQWCLSDRADSQPNNLLG